MRYLILAACFALLPAVLAADCGGHGDQKTMLVTADWLAAHAADKNLTVLAVGDPKQYEDGKVVERFKPQGTWIVRYNGQIYALSTTCTHLGCTPNWLEREEKFKCPCHGSG